MMLPTWLARFAVSALPLAVVLTVSAGAPQAHSGYEVWLIDQSNSPGTSHGGFIHVYDGGELTSAAPWTRAKRRPVRAETIDLSADTSALCLAATGVNPARPHMLSFNSTHTHAVLSFVASGHVVFFDARTREPLACFRTEPGAGGARQAHAAWPTTDDRYVLVANQNGKKLERIFTDYAGRIFVQEPAATLDLAGCTTPSGAACQDPALRPDNAPICPFTASDNGPAFVSLRGGGLFVVDWRTAPMSIVSEYDAVNVPANGCGFAEARGMVYANGGGATPANLDQFTVYRMPMDGHHPGNPPNRPATEPLFNDDAPERDAHGVAVTKDERYVWVGDRDGNVAEVFDAGSGARVNTVDLRSRFSMDPTPDLFATSPDRRWLFASTRGPIPLSGDPHSSLGTDPGLLVIRLTQSGRSGRVVGHVRISNLDAAGVERADAHGINVRRTARDRKHREPGKEK
jgi:hypothetical protein